MTGKKTNKQRFVVSSRLLVPSAVRKDMGEKAMEFKNAVSASIKNSQLDADVAVKAANMNSKPTYNDTDDGASGPQGSGSLPSAPGGPTDDSRESLSETDKAGLRCTVI